MSHQTESSPSLSAAESPLGRAVLPFSFPTPAPPSLITTGEHREEHMRGHAASSGWGTRLCMCWLCRYLRRHPWAGQVGSGLRMRVGEECCPQNFKGQGKAGARGNDTKMPSPKPWILLKKARNSDTNLSPVAEKGPIRPPSLSSVCSEVPEL